MHEMKFVHWLIDWLIIVVGNGNGDLEVAQTEANGETEGIEGNEEKTESDTEDQEDKDGDETKTNGKSPATAPTQKIDWNGAPEFQWKSNS